MHGIFSSISASYSEIRIEKGEEHNITIKDGEISAFSGTNYGVSARVLKNGSWGFASSNSVDCDTKQLLKKAERLAELERAGVRITPQESIRTQTGYKTAKAAKVRFDEEARTMKDAYKLMTGGMIRTTTMALVTSSTTSSFYNSEGSDIAQDFNYAYLSCNAISKSGENIQSGKETSSSISGFGGLKIYEAAETARKKAEMLLAASLPAKGVFDVIFDNELTGVFSHEAVGHACEGDAILEKESILHNKLGKKLGSSSVTIVDDPAAKDFGHYVYDDEGIRAKKTTLIEKGALKNYLHSRESSAKLGFPLNGHARACDYSSMPLVRMSNTYFVPGRTKKRDLFDVKNAVYLKGMRGGSVDTFSGGFMFTAEMGYEIRNGEKKRLLRDITITGNILTMLKNVELVGDDFATSPGFCGKRGQDVPVSDGGPHIRVKKVVIG